MKVHLFNGLTDGNGLTGTSYKGMGLGVVEVTAECMNLQETYDVLDCSFYDDCTSATHNTNWFNRNNLSTDYTGDVLKLTAGSNNGNYMPNREGTATSISDVTEWEPPFVFEYDVLTFDDATKHYAIIQSINRTYHQLGLTNESSHHIKLVYDGSKVYYYIDGSDTATYEASLSTTFVYCSVQVQPNSTQTIKNVKIYPI